MKIQLNGIEVTLTTSQLEQAHREWEAIQKDKPKVGDWVTCAAPGIIRFGKVTLIDGGGEYWAQDGLLGYPGGVTKDGGTCDRVARKATESEVAFFLGLFPDRFKA